MGPTHPPHDLDVGRPGAVARRDGVHDAQYVPLHHADEVGVVLAQGHVAEVLDEVHDVCAVVHGELPRAPTGQLSGCGSRKSEEPTDPFQLLQDARVQVLVHVSVLEGVVGGFLGGVGGGVEVLELGGEAHADFEGVGHGMWEELRRATFSLRVGF